MLHIPGVERRGIMLVNNNGNDQSVCMRSLIYALVICKCKQAKNKFSNADAYDTFLQNMMNLKVTLKKKKQSKEQFTGIIENEKLIKTKIGIVNRCISGLLLRFKSVYCSRQEYRIFRN